MCVCVCDMYKFDDFFLQKLKYLTCWNVYSVLIILATVFLTMKSYDTFVT